MEEICFASLWAVLAVPLSPLRVDGAPLSFVCGAVAKEFPPYSSENDPAQSGGRDGEEFL